MQEKMKLPKIFVPKKSLKRTLEDLAKGPKMRKMVCPENVYDLLAGWELFRKKQKTRRSYEDIYNVGKEIAENLDYTDMDLEDLTTKFSETTDKFLGLYFSALMNKIMKRSTTLRLEIKNKPEGLGAYLEKGKLIVNGNIGDDLGHYMQGGKIIVHGNVGDYMGFAMKGGRIIVHGDIGKDAGMNMMYGRMIIYGNVKSVGEPSRIKKYKKSKHIIWT